MMAEGITGIPDDYVVVFVDGADVMYGGCSGKEFFERFTTILQATGAKIILGAGYNCFEQQHDCSTFPSPHRDEVLQAFGLTAQMVDEGGSYVVICPGFYNQSCLCRYPESSKRIACVGCRYPGCSLKFLSTGIAAGYAVHIPASDTSDQAAAFSRFCCFFQAFFSAIRA